MNDFFSALDASAPTLAGPVIVHGDFKLANMLWADGDLVAVLDWEMAFNGDARWDLAQMLAYVPGPAGPGAWSSVPAGFWLRERTLYEFSQRSGLPTDDILWFEAAQCARGAIVMAYCHRLWRDGRSTDPRFEKWGRLAAQVLEKGRRFLTLHSEARGSNQA